MRRAHAFTIVELLVVISIVAVLAALLFSVYARAKAGANGSACVTSVRQLSAALALYAEDQGGRLPPSLDGMRPSHGGYPATASTFYDLAERYRGGALLCLDRNRASDVPTGLATGYALNGRPEDTVFVPGGSHVVGWKPGEAEFPTRTILLAEARAGITGLYFADQNAPMMLFGTHVSGVFLRFKDSTEGSRRHNGRGNYTFVDGHTKSYQGDQMNRLPPNGPTFALRPRD